MLLCENDSNRALSEGPPPSLLQGSGAGKTTLASVLLGKEAATGGSVTLEVIMPVRVDATREVGSDARIIAPGDCMRPLLGFVPQVRRRISWSLSL